MEREDVERATFQYYESGFHCAEAIVKAVLEFAGDAGAPALPRAASGLGGGIGGGQHETCGALTGGVVALGWLYGRIEPAADKSRIYALASEFRERFARQFGSTRCEAILRQLGPQEGKVKCKRLTAEAAGMVAEILAGRAERSAVLS